MASYLRLFPPTQQFELRNGQLNVAGQLKVFYEGTDDLAAVYDVDGTQLAQPVILDDNGRSLGLFVDAARVYRLEVYDRYGELIYTVRKMVPSGGGAGSALGKEYEVVSTDGTVKIQKFDNGGTIVFDLSTEVEDEPSKYGVQTSLRSSLDGDGDWHQLEPVSTDGSMTYLDGWVMDKDCVLDIAATVEIPAADANALRNVDIMCNVTVDGTIVHSDTGHLDPTVNLQKISFEWKGEVTQGQVVACQLYAASTESLSCGFAGRVYVNEECDGVVGGGGGANYIPGQYIDISEQNVISVTGLQPSGSYVTTQEFTYYQGSADNRFSSVESSVTNISSVVSAFSSDYLPQSASSMFQPSGAYQTAGDYAYNSSLSSKVDQSAFDDCCSAVHSALDDKFDKSASGMFAVSGDYAYNSSLSAYYPASASGAFQPSGNYQTAGDYAFNSAVSSKLDASASGSFVLNSAFSSWSSEVDSSLSSFSSSITSINSSITNIENNITSMSSDVSGKVDTSSMSAWIPYSALDYSGTAISGIGGSSLAGMGGGADYTGIYPVNVDNDQREISVDSLPLVTDATMTSYASGDSSVIGVAPGVFFSSLPVSGSAGNDSAYYGLQSAKLRSQYDGIDLMPNTVRFWENGFSAVADYSAVKRWDSAASSVSAKLDATAQVVSATATQLYAGTNYVTSINATTLSAERAGRAGNATLATSAYYDTNSRFISALPDSAAVSSIASSYAESAASSKQDTLSFAYNAADQISSINGSALGGMDEAAVSGIASAYAESAASSKLDASASSSFYSTSNPSGFITGVDLSPYQTTADMSSYIPTSMSSDFQQVSAMTSYALSSDVSATVDLVGAQSANWSTNADWAESASSSPAYIDNKPDLVDIVAGPGIVVDNPDGNTLRVSCASAYETVLWDGPSEWVSSGPTIAMSETISNFERIGIYAAGYADSHQWDYHEIKLSADDTANGAPFNIQGAAGDYSFARFNVGLILPRNGGQSLAFTGFKQFNLGSTVNTAQSPSKIQKIVGIHRTASN